MAEFEKLKITVSNGDESDEYEADQAVMVLINWKGPGELTTSLVSNSDKTSTYAHAIRACASHLEDNDLSESGTLMGSVVNKALGSVLEAVDAAANATSGE